MPMTADDHKGSILVAVGEFNRTGDATRLDLLAKIIWEAYEARQALREKGYGWMGLSLLETVRQEVPRNPDEA